MKARIVGGGLIGTSIALKVAKLGGMAQVLDRNEAHERVANGLLGQAVLPRNEAPELVIVATPVDSISMVVVEELALNPSAIVIDTGSIKTKVQLEVWTKLHELNRADHFDRYLPTHPMAGRELSGPDSARSDLFESRPWAITPHVANDESAVAFVESFISSMGAICYRMSAEEHDRQVAMTSHLPQLLASALAGVLEEPLDLAGQGLRDMTRLATSDISMWQPILAANSDKIRPLLNEIIKSINELNNKNFNSESVLAFMEQGARGAGRVPGKHGGKPRNYGALSVVIPDESGQLARLFDHCAEAKINIEDLRIEHSPGQKTGLISLYVNPGDLSTLNNHLSTLGWHTTTMSEGH